jgi:hypothetical protein
MYLTMYIHKYIYIYIYICLYMYVSKCFISQPRIPFFISTMHITGGRHKAGLRQLQQPLVRQHEPKWLRRNDHNEPTRIELEHVAKWKPTVGLRTCHQKPSTNCGIENMQSKFRNQKNTSSLEDVESNPG